MGLAQKVQKWSVSAALGLYVPNKTSLKDVVLAIVRLQWSKVEKVAKSRVGCLKGGPNKLGQTESAFFDFKLFQSYLPSTG